MLLGAEEQKFIAHRDILIGSSTFFRSALTHNGWREREVNIVRLPEQDAAFFSIYLHWLYNNPLELWNGDDSILREEYQETVEHKADSRYNRIIDCYALGSYLGDDKFCNTLIDTYFDVRETIRRWPRGTKCNQAVRKLPENSKLRLLIVHHIALSASPQSVEQRIGDLDPELVKDVALAAIYGCDDAEKRKSPWERGREFYYLPEKVYMDHIHASS